jgi:methyl-accepting chemotaxis protein
MQVTAEAINNMDLEKIVEARTMFEALAALTHGGEPADILAQMGASLEDALQNLADMLTEFKGSVEQGAASTNELGSTMKDIFKKPDNTAAAKPAAQQQAPPEVDVSSIVAAIEDLESTLTARGIRVTST